MVRVKGSAVGRAPAARWALAAIAWRILSRPGGVAEVVVTAARCPMVAVRSARASRRAAAMLRGAEKMHPCAIAAAMAPVEYS